MPPMARSRAHIPSEPSEPLNDPRAERYCQARAAGMSGVQAYAQAGYEGNPDAGSNVRQIERRAHVQARIRYLTAEAIAPMRLNIETLFNHIQEQGTFDPVVFEGVKSLTDLKSKVDEPTRRLLVKGWKFDKYGNFILELVDKDVALDRIARHLSFYNDKVRVDMGTFGDTLARAEKQIG